MIADNMPQAASSVQGSGPSATQGVFETILVFEDRPVELKAHLERLRHSVGTLYDRDLPAVDDQVRAACRGGWLGRLRLTVAPDDSGELNSSIVVTGFDPNNVFPTGPFATALHSVRIERGYGDHKWADREALVRAEAAAGPNAVPLLVGPGDQVLEASRANIFAVVEPVVLTPPLDGEILPGIARAGVIEVAAELGIELREESLSRVDLPAADEVFLTGSLRGVEPVRAIDGIEIDRDGPITRALAAGLRQRWFAGAP